MSEKLILLMATGGAAFVFAAVLLLPSLAGAQLPAQPVPSDRQNASPPLDGGPEGTAAPGASLGNTSSANVDREQEERLIDEYRRQAGTVGPRKLFSDFKVDPHFGLGIAYDDNILVSGGSRQLGDAITTLAGGVTVSLGDFATRTNSFLILNYTATGEIFAIHSDQNAVDHDASLVVRYQPHQFSVQLTSSYQLTHDATADLGERVSQQVYGGDLLLRYLRNDYTTLEAEAVYSNYSYAGRDSNSQISGGIAAEYLLADKVTIGGGIVGGHLEGSNKLNEDFVQFQARLGYNITNQINLSLRAGLEVRERGGGAGMALDPVFSLAGTWTPYSGTKLTLEGHRSTEASASVAGDDYISTGLQVTVRQHLFQRFYAELGAGYENAVYENITSVQATVRKDDYYTLRVAVGYDFVEFVKAEVFYSYRNDRSNQAFNAFTSNRVGVQVNFVY